MDPIAKDAKVIVDAVLEQYIKYISETSDATEDKLYRQLVDQYNSLKNEIQGRESVCTALRKSLGTETPQERLSNKRLRLDEAQARLNELRNRIQLLAWELKLAAGTTDGNSPVGQSKTKPKYHKDAEWRKLDIAARTIQHNIAADQLDTNDPAAVRARRDLTFAQELLRLREAQLDEQWNDRRKDRAAPGGGVVPVDRQLARAKVEEQLLRAEWEKQSADFNDLFDRAQSLARENAALQQKRELFDAVRQRLEQKNMERGVPGSIEVLTGASVPSKPAPDHRILFTAGAILLGLCAAGGTGVLTRRRKNIPAGSGGST
jgi:division protein CdvB (Snf7/Vps24/ESCRT-III family)